MHRITGVLAVSLLGSFATLSAQQQLHLLQGQQVSVTAAECGLRGQVGAFENVSGDTLVFVYGTSFMRCRRTAVTRLYVHRGLKSRWESWMFLGSIYGGFSTGITTAAVCDAFSGNNCVLATVGGTAIGGALGALLGAGIGALIRTDHWEEVRLDRLRVGVAPRHDGLFALGLSVRF